MLSISVVICTHNPREAYLRRVLDALRAQTLPVEQWELLLVDNASAQPLAPVWDLSWHPRASHLREEKVGLTHARLCGIAAAQGELLVFVDDDNLLRADYLQAALTLGIDYPQLGAWSGSCVAEYETEPAPELRPWLLSVLVVETFTMSFWAKLPTGNLAVPSGAGMVVRRQVASHYRELVSNDPVRRALGRSGSHLGGGEDSDMALSGFALGFGCGRFPELELIHLIPSTRLTLAYFAGVHEGFGYSGEVLNAIHSRSEFFPGQIHSGSLRLLLLRVILLVTRKSRVERTLRLARENGRLRARRELKKIGYSKTNITQ